MSAARRLTQAQLRYLEHELRSERARLERSIATRIEAEDATPARGATPVEGGLATVLETRIVDRHAMLDSAVRRLEAGTYGLCASCHNPIPYGRLLAMPEVAYCVGCGRSA